MAPPAPPAASVPGHKERKRHEERIRVNAVDPHDIIRLFNK
jgi:hypothetical protein